MIETKCGQSLRERDKCRQSKALQCHIIRHFTTETDVDSLSVTETKCGKSERDKCRQSKALQYHTVRHSYHVLGFINLF